MSPVYGPLELINPLLQLGYAASDGIDPLLRIVHRIDHGLRDVLRRLLHVGNFAARRLHGIVHEVRDG